MNAPSRTGQKVFKQHTTAKQLFLRASITLSQPEGEHKTFHHIKQKTETIFDPQTKKTLTAPQTKQLSRLRRQREFLGLLGKGNFHGPAGK